MSLLALVVALTATAGVYAEAPLQAAPVLHWARPLPGDRVNSATHTERTRPVVVDDALLVGAAGGDALYMLSRTSGDLLRRYPALGSVESEPVVQDDRIWFTDTGGYTWCYDLQGQVLWSRESSAPILVRPTVHDGIVYVTNVDDLALALDAETGELLWRYQRKPDLTRAAELALYAAPPAVVVGDEVLLGFSDGSLVSLDRTTGDPRWDRRVGEGRYPDLVAEPVSWRSDILASGYFEPLVAIDRSSQNVRWRVDAGAASAVLVHEVDGADVIFHPGTDGVLRAVVALTGAVRWSWDSRTGGALTAPVWSDAGVFVGSSDGSLYLVEPTSGEETWRWSEPWLLEGVTSAPVVSGRQLLFVTNAGRIYSMLSPVPQTLDPQRGQGGARLDLREDGPTY